MALADTSVLGNPEIYRLFAFRFPDAAEPEELRRWLGRMVRGTEPQVAAIPEPLRSIVRRHLGFFREAMPNSFDLQGANIGNLVLTGGYLNQGRQLDPVLYLFSQLVEVRGVVRPVVDQDLHLVAELADGRTLIGQHNLTGKEHAALDSPVTELYLSRSKTRPVPHRPRISEAVDELVRSADLICYPVGSFYSSLIATLLPEGVSAAISETVVPKVYVPNPGPDPEEFGMTLVDKVRTLLRYLKAGTPKRTSTDRLLTFVMIDRAEAGITRKTIRAVEKLGVEVIDTPLITESSGSYLDDDLLAESLLSLT